MQKRSSFTTHKRRQNYNLLTLYQKHPQGLANTALYLYTRINKASTTARSRVQAAAIYWKTDKDHCNIALTYMYVWRKNEKGDIVLPHKY